MVKTADGVSHDAEFWELILDDDELLRAEFEALIAAERPASATTRLRAARRRPDDRRRTPSLTSHPETGAADGPDLKGWRRERSPPKVGSPVVPKRNNREGG